MSRPSRKSVIRSFRVDQAALEIIEKDAQEKNISVNTLVNQLILAYVNLDRYLDQFPMIKIASEGFGLLLDGVSDEYAKESARKLALNIVQSQIMSRRGDLSLSAILEHFRTVSEYSKVFTLKEAESNGKKIITLYHRYGRKGSIWYLEYVVSLLELAGVHPKIKTTENSVTASL
jgi:hypothetical protein